MKILVVDDDQFLREGLVSILSGHDVTAVHTLQEGLNLVDEGPDTWDLVIVDLRLYPVWGPGLVEAIRDRSKRLHSRTMLWTGYPLRAHEKQVLQERFGVPVVDKMQVSTAWFHALLGCVRDGASHDDPRWPI